MKSVCLTTLIALLAFSCAARALTPVSFLRGSAIEVIDGENVTISIDNRIVKVRLCAVSAPKKPHAFAEIARSHLAALIQGKQVQVDYNRLDPDGTVVGIVTFEGVDIGLQMIRDGAALYNRTDENDVPSESRHVYEESEQAAKAEVRGIWQTPLNSSPPDSETTAVKSPENPKTANESAGKLNDEAYSLINRENYKAALPKLQEALKLDPTLADAHKNLALIFCDWGRYQDALSEVKEAIRLNYNSDKAHNILGKTLLGLSDVEGAIREFKEAIRLNPKYAKAYYNLGVAFDRAGRLRDSLAAYYEAEKVAPEWAAVQLNLGSVLNKLGKQSEARARWTKVLTMSDPRAAIVAQQNLSASRF